MERVTTAVFIGHRDCYELTEEAIISKIEEAITMGVTTFLNGGMGHFDHLCAKAVDRLKANYPEIKQVLIKPYDSLKVTQCTGAIISLVPQDFERYSSSLRLPLHPRQFFPVRVCRTLYSQTNMSSSPS